MSLRRFLLSVWCISALLMPATALADGACHEPCMAPGGTCNAGLQCIGDSCELANGQDCSAQPNPGGNIGANGGETDGIFLLEPIGGVGSIPTVGNEGLGVFQFYFNLLYPWIVGMGAGIAVFMGVYGGIEIIQSGGDQGKADAGKNRLLLSLAGLLIILASATILNTLNPTFYR